MVVGCFWSKERLINFRSNFLSRWESSNQFIPLTERRIKGATVKNSDWKYECTYIMNLKGDDRI